MKLVWTHLASIDRRKIRQYIAQNNPASALVLDERFSATANSLVDQPDMGRPGRVTGTRELVVHRHYIMVYDVTKNLVRVLRLLHTARKWPL